MTDRYALIGHPVKQSLSPIIHARFAEATAQDMRYDLLDVEPAAFDAAVKQFFADGGKGLNVTLPHKAAACALAGRVSDHARVAQAANTLIFGEDIVADNTDGTGLIRDLAYHQFAVDGRAILIVGAGGACRGIVQPLLEAGAREILIANRTAERAEQLIDDIRRATDDADAVRAASMDASAPLRCDAVINATSASLDGLVPALPALAPDALEWGYDLAYAKEDGKTAFVAWLEARGVAAQDGYGMLIEQAAESFYLWRGVRPPTEGMRSERGRLSD